VISADLLFLEEKIIEYEAFAGSNREKKPWWKIW
jgi:hypothetical protein